jgi:hypothetical protein
MIIDTIHGIVQNANSHWFVHRNLLDAARFSTYLKDRGTRYVPLKDALQGTGEALTIDDSIAGAAAAARLARKYGHAVTLFLNGYNIEAGRPYFFSRLNVALDTRTVDKVDFENATYELCNLPSTEKFRRAVKRRLAEMGDEDQRQDFVTGISRLLKASEFNVPPYLAPIDRKEVQQLARLGVDIQNHGWTHTRVGSSPPDGLAKDIRRGREWLKATCDSAGQFFAIPNGDGLPVDKESPDYEEWFLLTGSKPQGRIGPGLVNRRIFVI